MICRLDILFDIGYDNEALLSEVVTSGAHHINSAPGSGARWWDSCNMNM